MTQIYNDPAGGSESSVGPQLRIDFYKKKALIEARKEMYFMPLSDTTNMPKHFGKTIKCYHYIPLLDDANINDQGIDATGNTTTNQTYTARIGVYFEDGTDRLGNPVKRIVHTPHLDGTLTGPGYVRYFTADAVWNTDEATTQADAIDNVIAKVIAWAAAAPGAGGLGVSSTEVANDDKFDDIVTNSAMLGGDASPYQLGYRFVDTAGNTITGAASVTASDTTYSSGNLYGSSKDVGTIVGKLPTLSETGGRVNRVGFTRITLESNLEKYGFFDEYTQESMDFDTDAELMMHINREMVNGAVEITEDCLQIDLLNAAGIVRYGGTAVTDSQLNGDDNTYLGTTDVSSFEIDYNDLLRMSIDLDNNRCPKQTKIIAGSRMIDTKTIDAGRLLYIGSELIPMFRRMTDLNGNPAFIPVQQYADASTIMNGEIGAVDQFRIIVVPEMMHWEGAGAAVGGTGNEGVYRNDGTNYNVYPMLCVGSQSFTTIGFQTGGNNAKFTITHKKPGKEIADRNDPYGEVGFMSIKWYYGILITRPERIALAKTIAQW